MVNSSIRKGTAARIPRRGSYPTAAARGAQQSNNGGGGGFNWVWLIVFIIVLFIILVLLALYQYARRRRRAAAGNARAAFRELPKPGLDSSTIADIPAFTYSNVVKANSGGLRDKECVVCLGGVVEGEVLRELPKCKHVFHLGCIDKWLKSHATCPVCRVDAEPAKEEAALPLSNSGSSLGEEEKEGRWSMGSSVEKQGRRVHVDETNIERQ